MSKVDVVFYDLWKDYQFTDIFGEPIPSLTEEQSRWFRYKFSERLGNCLMKVGCRSRADVIVLITFHLNRFKMVPQVGKKTVSEAEDWCFSQSEFKKV